MIRVAGVSDAIGIAILLQRVNDLRAIIQCIEDAVGMATLSLSRVGLGRRSAVPWANRVDTGHA